MSWAQGDLITADRLNTENGNNKKTINLTNTTLTAGKAWYFYSTRKTGTLVNLNGYASMYYTGIFTLARWENNTWAQKTTESLSGGSEYNVNLNSYGEGYYMLYNWDKYNVTILNISVYNASTSCERGSYLAMINNMGILDADSQPYRVSGQTITAADLNAGKVYTL